MCVEKMDLVRKRCFLILKVKLQMIKLPMQAFQRSLRQKNRFLATCLLLALLKTKLTWISSMLFYLTHFVARFFASHLRFCLRGSIGLVLCLAIDGTVLRVGKVAVGLLEWCLWNKLMSILKYYIAETTF